MRVVLATIVLNEAEMIPRLLGQHVDWPGMVSWIFVEGATGIFGQAHPDVVGQDGLSVDGTGALLSEAARRDGRVVYVPHGWSSAPEVRPGQQKEVLRNACCALADRFEPELLVVLDADELYTRSAQAAIVERALSDGARFDAWLYRQRHLWRPPSVCAEAITAREVVGGYWSVPHVRVWRYVPGARYRDNHNHLCLPGRDFDPDRMYRFGRGDPECVHLGFAREGAHRRRTNAYYVARGEGRERVGKNRRMYVDCRAAWEGWRPGDRLPHGARVVPYAGPVPAVLADG